MTLRAKLFHPATAIAVLALLAAAGGPSWAAGLVGTAGLRAGAVTTAKLAPGSVTTPKIKAGAVTTAKLARGAVQGTAIFDGAITRSKLSRGAVDSLVIVPGAVETPQLHDGAVTTPKLADGAVTTTKLGAASITGAQVAADAITADKIADGQVVEGGGRLLSNRLLLPAGAGSQLLDVVGVGNLLASCSTGVTDLTFTNGTDATMTVVAVETIGAFPTDTTEISRVTLGPGGSVGLPGTGTRRWDVQASATDAAGRDHVATLEVTSGSDLGTCVVTAQGLTTG
jgi:hypothetical protein